jgi:hypothetical protein
VSLTDLSPTEFARLFDDDVSSLEPDARAILDRFSVSPQRAVHEFVGWRTNESTHDL